MRLAYLAATIEHDTDAEISWHKTIYTFFFKYVDVADGAVAVAVLFPISPFLSSSFSFSLLFFYFYTFFPFIYFSSFFLSPLFCFLFLIPSVNLSSFLF